MWQYQCWLSSGGSPAGDEGLAEFGNTDSSRTRDRGNPKGRGKTNAEEILRGVPFPLPQYLIWRQKQKPVKRSDFHDCTANALCYYEIGIWELLKGYGSGDT